MPPSEPPHTWRRPALRPGVLVTRRGEAHLQVGLDPAVLASATESNRRLLADLTAGRSVPPERRSGALWRRLVEHGLLVDGDELTRWLSSACDDGATVAAVHAAAGARAPDLLAGRARRSVRVEAPGRWRDLAEDLLDRCGLGPAVATAEPDVRLVVSLGPLDRDRLDDAMRDDLAHLVVSGTDRGIEVGPFVAPGLTACLRCADAARAEHDPLHTLVVDQQTRQGAWRADGVPAPWDPALATVALGWAVRDIVSYLDGQVPTTWSATLALGPGMEQTWHRWRRHPRCGCAWLALTRAE